MPSLPMKINDIAQELSDIQAHLKILTRQTSRAYLTALHRDWRPNSNSALFQTLVNRAIARSADIVEAEMPRAMIFDNTTEMLRYCLTKAEPDGAHAEFGVFSGRTINFFASERPGVTFDGFDSFEGLPEEWTGWQPFEFDRKAQPPDVRANVKLHIGWFEDTLPAYATNVHKMSFLHIDCDLYSSTATIFLALGDKIGPGCVIVFDEYFCYPNFEQHERRALAEFLEARSLEAEWIAVCGARAACILMAPPTPKVEAPPSHHPKVRRRGI